MQTVDNHITHTAAPGAALSPIHSLWNVLIPVFVLSPRLYLPWFRVFTVILIRAEPSWSTISIFVFVLRTGWLSSFYRTTPSSFTRPLISCWALSGAYSVPAVSVLWLNRADCVNLSDMLFFCVGKTPQAFLKFTHIMIECDTTADNLAFHK